MHEPDGADRFAHNALTQLTEEQLGSIQGWLDAVAPTLGVHGWRIYLSRHEAPADSTASSHIRDQSDETWVALSRGWPDIPERRQRACLAHELLHCHFQRITRLSELLLETELGTRTEAVLLKAVSVTEEQAIERLAWAISEFLPPCPEL